VNCTYCGHETAAGECPICGASHVRDTATLDIVMLALPRYHVEAGHRLGTFSPAKYATDALCAVRFGVPLTRLCMLCRRVENDGDWHAVVTPQDRPITHTLCPDCEAAGRMG